MKRARNLLIAGCSLFLLCQCAAKDDVRDLSYQIRTVNKKVDDMRGTTVDQMQKKQASSFSRIDEVNEELLQMRAALEENTVQNSHFREQTKEHVASLKTKVNTLQEEQEKTIKALEARIDQLSNDLESIRQDRIRDAEKRVQDAARQADEARKRTIQAASSRSSAGMVKIEPERRKSKIEESGGGADKPVVVAAPEQKAANARTSTPPPSSSGDDPFGKAMGLFKSKRYKDAYSAFEQVLSGNPRGDRAAETLFYMGESLFNQGEFDLAILDYQKVISNHPKHDKKPAALLKQGMSFEKLTDLETAKIIYKKLTAEHPSSSEAQTANSRLEKL